MTDGWTHLPALGNLDGSAGNLSICAGCRTPCGRQPTWTCLFCRSGFSTDGRSYRPCQIRYHIGCVRSGPPFRSRHRDPSQGLSFNQEFADFPFVCEYCTVRANLGRDLNATHLDMQLLMLERMRMIDCSNAWSPGTSRSVASNLRQLRRFAGRFGIPWNTLHFQEQITAPPRGPSMLVLWTMEWHTLQTTGKEPGERVRYNSARHLWSALHSRLAWEGTLLPEGLAFREKDRLNLPPLVSASGSLLVQLTTSGMERRLGTDSNPSIALQAQHVRRNLADREATLARTRSPSTLTSSAWRSSASPYCG